MLFYESVFSIFNFFIPGTYSFKDEQPDLLQDLDETVWYKDATLATRFLNFLIDIICVIILASVIIAFFFPDFEAGSLNDRILGYVLFLAYYTILEIGAKGRTIGKMITRTKAIRVDGGELTGSDALLRSLSRLVPLEPLSTLGGQPWHDRWTKTRVIKLP